MFRRAAVRILASLTAAALLGACGEAEDPTKARMRLVNASGYAQLDLRVDGEVRQGATGYGSSPGYFDVDPDEADTQITVAGSTTPLLSFTPAVSERRHYTTLAYGNTGALRQVVLEENVAEPDANKSLLRVINAAPDAGAVDVYLTDAGDTLGNAVPVQSNAAYGTLGPWITLDSRNWRLRVTSLNNKAELRLDIPLSLTSRQVATLVLSSAGGGVLVNGLLVTQQAAVTRYDVASARVRAATGVSGSAAVTVRFGNTTVIDQAPATAVGNYTLVPAGPQTLAVEINGQPLATAPHTLAAGADYTVLVHGAPLAPVANLIGDDNRVPSDTGQARIRLVNGVGGLVSPAMLTVDLTPVGAPVAAGAASAYESFAATTTAELRVTSVGEPAPLYQELDRTLLAGSTYSVFVLGDKAAPRGLLRRDR